MNAHSNESVDAFSIFYELLDHPTDQLMPNLAQMNELNEDVHCEVKELVKAHIKNKQDHFLHKLVSHSTNIALGNDELLFMHGEVIEGYVLSDLIGEGGQGVVYKAHRCDGKFEQTVAIKLLYPNTAIVSGEKTLKREAQSLAKFQHSGIARVFTIGEYQHHCYMIMDYIDAPSMDKFFSTHLLTLERVIDIFIKICEALEHAHAHQVLHADIKPSNILINKNMQPLLIDFGISKQVSVSSKLDNKALGFTYRFSSPEQQKGEPLDYASDVYSVAKVMQYFLSQYFANPTLKARLLKPVLAKALSENPNERIGSITSLKTSIAAVQALCPVEFETVSRLDKLKCLYARRSMLFKAVGVALLICLPLLIAFSIQRATIAGLFLQQTQVSAFLQSIFETTQSDGHFHDILNQNSLPSFSDNQIKNIEGHGKILSPYVFTNHGGKVGEPIKLKVVSEHTTPADVAFTILGDGYISHTGHYMHRFSVPGIHTVTIEAVKNAKEYDKLVLRFVIRDGRSLPIKFDDVSTQHPYFDNIHYLALRGVVIGRPNPNGSGRLFQPSQIAKQAEVLSILYLAAHEQGIIKLKKTQRQYSNLQIVNDKGYIEDFSWASAYLSHAEQQGLSIDPAHFDPKKPASKAWTARTVSQLLDLYDPSQLNNFKHIEFKDHLEFENTQLLKYAKICVLYGLCAAHGGHFQPQRAVTRAEVANIGAKILKLSKPEILESL
ncbi:hypothetical protein A7985_07145 [Pseudoalteromonas luteoviolacea]|uniref:Uncharacterized protein n=1 Tax=Pseudoalteromonas luteoviolacea TaxID=43657 RepID=A0A1C0TWL6_9GAMM|nr:serine/threonine protein kinase [Pseudoalteromonas luteoviolacea]OCQ23711.1 hypothetical protein A7985_07145 [Pseudoalteromonas luteoviolacea]